MVFSKKGLDKISLEGYFYSPPSLACLVHSPFVDERLDDENDPDIHHAFPSLHNIERRATIEEMRKRVYKPVKKRLTHSPRENNETVSGRETFLYLDPQPEEGQVGFAGFDIRCGQMIAESDKVIPGFRDPWEAQLEFAKMHPKYLNFGEEFVLENDPFGRKVYYILSHEGVLHSDNLELIVDSKSTTGRVGALSHFCGYDIDGKLITMIRPFSFPLKIRAGVTRLSQAVLRYKGTSYLQNGEVLENGEVKLYGDDVNLTDFICPRGLLMRFDTRKMYRAKKYNGPIDMDSKNKLDPQKYFELIEGNREFDFDENTLYLLGSLGILDIGAVCGILSKHDGVLTGIQSLGNLAGVIQPFFRGGITMEYYNPVKTRISTFDPAGYILFDKLDGEFRRPKDYGGSYQDQIAPKLPKMFKV